jgi:hypothetical protein
LNAQSAWHNGLLLTLLAWMLAGWSYHQTLAPASPVDELYTAHNAPSLWALAPRPLPPISPRRMTDLWFAICLLCLLGSAGLFAQSAGLSLLDAAPLGVILIVGFLFVPTLLDFRRGHFNLPLLALLCTAYLADSRDRSYRLAVCIAAAALIQTWVLALLLYLLPRRRPLAFVCGVALFCGLSALLLASAGLRNVAAFPQTFVRLLRPAPLPGDASGGSAFANQSIVGLANYWLAPNADAASPLDSPVPMYTAIVVGFIIIIGGLWLACRRFPVAGGDHARLLLGLATVSALLVLPVGKRTYFILLLPALWTLLTLRLSPAIRLAAIAVLVILTSAVVATLTPWAFFIAAVVVWVALVGAIEQELRRPVPSL